MGGDKDRPGLDPKGGAGVARGLVELGERIAGGTERTLRKMIPGTGDAETYGESLATVDPPVEYPESVDHRKLTLEEKVDRMAWLESRLLEPMGYDSREAEVREHLQLQRQVMAEGTRDELRAEHNRIHETPELVKWDRRLEAKLQRMDKVQVDAERGARVLREVDNFEAAVGIYANARRADEWAGVEQMLRYMSTQDAGWHGDLESVFMRRIREGVPKLADQIVQKMEERGMHVADGRGGTTFGREFVDRVESGQAGEDIGHFGVGVAKAVGRKLEDAGRYIKDPVGAAGEDLKALSELPGKIADVWENRDQIPGRISRAMHQASDKEIAEGVAQVAVEAVTDKAAGSVAKLVAGTSKAAEVAEGAEAVSKARRVAGESIDDSRKTGADGRGNRAGDSAGPTARGDATPTQAPRPVSPEATPVSPDATPVSPEATPVSPEATPVRAEAETALARKDRPSLERTRPVDPTNPEVRRELHEAIDATIEQLDTLDHPGTKVETTLHRGPPIEHVDPPRRTAPAGEPDWVPEETLTPERLRQHGMPLENQSKIQRIADDEGVEILVRPGTEEAAGQLERGAHPKYSDVKAKSIGESDVAAGWWQKGDQGKVGYAKPEPPPSELPPGMTREAWREQWKAWHERDAAYSAEGKKMTDLQKSPEFQRGAQDDPLHGTQKELQIEVSKDGVVTGIPEGKPQAPLAGDHDLWEIRRDGKPVSQAEHDRIVQRMVKGDMGVRHGALKHWEVNPKVPSEKTLKDGLIRQHESGDKALIRFAPRETPTTVRARSRDVGAPGEGPKRGERTRGEGPSRVGEGADRSGEGAQRRGEGTQQRGDGPQRQGEKPPPRGEKPPPREQPKPVERPARGPEGSQKGGGGSGSGSA